MREAHWSLRTPHLLPVYDYDGQHDPPFIVMRYLEAAHQDVLERCILPIGSGLYDAANRIRAGFAHRHNVIRDIKPSNIMVDEDKRFPDCSASPFDRNGEGMTADPD
jgi:serine/threonine protein kinase